MSSNEASPEHQNSLLLKGAYNSVGGLPTQSQNHALCIARLNFQPDSREQHAGRYIKSENAEMY